MLEYLLHETVGRLQSAVHRSRAHINYSCRQSNLKLTVGFALVKTSISTTAQRSVRWFLCDARRTYWRPWPLICDSTCKFSLGAGLLGIASPAALGGSGHGDRAGLPGSPSAHVPLTLWTSDFTQSGWLSRPAPPRPEPCGLCLALCGPRLAMAALTCVVLLVSPNRRCSVLPPRPRPMCVC